MSMSSPFVIVLTTIEEAVLTARARSARGQHRDVIRARIVLAAAQGRPNAVVAAELGVVADTVRKWRSRFATGRMPGLGGPAPVRASAPVHAGAGRPGQGLGLYPAAGVRRAAVAVVQLRAGGPGHQ